MAQQQAFQWERQPVAAGILLDFLKQGCTQHTGIQQLSAALSQQTSSRLCDWVDHLILQETKEMREKLEQAGFVELERTQECALFHHPGAVLGKVVLKKGSQPLLGVTVMVESIVDFLQVRGLSRPIEGAVLGGYRFCHIEEENGVSLGVCERRGTQTITPTEEEEGYVERYLRAAELWRTRPRTLFQEEEAMEQSQKRAEEMVELVGEGVAACLVMEGERDYWERRNHAGFLQKGRQDRLGMGWGNHDHHTFRSSRQLFPKLIHLMETLGFHCRERFYAGEEAGWGAQVMENSACGIVLFLDLDLSPGEIEIDFAHQPLPQSEKLGTIGLWCALHGDSILGAGMHHLEAQFHFDELRQDLGECGVQMMPPFSDFSYLKQAFTQGEVWKVEPSRLHPLVEQGQITQEQADHFSREGAVGSHLENLERNDGYKGFNQKNVSWIIKKTDPRALEVTPGG